MKLKHDVLEYICAYIQQTMRVEKRKTETKRGREREREERCCVCCVKRHKQSDDVVMEKENPTIRE
jgi:hypothetical protein